MMSFSVGTAIGPTVGGIVLEYFWWGAVFLLGVPIMLLLLVTAPFLLPEYRAPQGGKLDFISALLFIAAFLPFIYGLKEIAKYGFEALPVIAIAAGLIVGWVFVRRQRNMDDPLLDVKLFQNRAFSGALAAANNIPRN